MNGEEIKKWLLGSKGLLFLCIVSYAFIHHYDTKWDMPLLAWLLMGLLAGSVPENFLAALPLAGWIYLWIVLRKPKISLDNKLAGAFICLYAFALFFAYREVGISLRSGRLDSSTCWFVFPFLLFIASTLLLFKQLMK